MPSDNVPFIPLIRLMVYRHRFFAYWARGAVPGLYYLLLQDCVHYDDFSRVQHVIPGPGKGLEPILHKFVPARMNKALGLLRPKDV